MNIKLIFDKTLWFKDIMDIAETNEEKDIYMGIYKNEKSWVNKCHNKEIMYYDAFTDDYIIIINETVYHVYEEWCRKVVEN